MSLLTIPAELRLRIYDFLPDLTHNVHQEVLPLTKLRPSICRVNSILRRETLPIYAADSMFSIRMDDSPQTWQGRIDRWISAQGSAISQIGSLRISCHWKILQPQRNERHVGFYVRVDALSRGTSSLDMAAMSSLEASVDSPVVASRRLKVTTGTYPMYVDGFLTKSTAILHCQVWMY